MPLCDPRILDRLPARQLRSPGKIDPRLHELLRRASLLEPRDFLLIRLVVEDHLSIRRAAQVLQVPHGTLARRFQRVAARLHEPLVIALCNQHCPLSQDIRQLGIEHFLQGRRMSELAELHRMSVDRVREILSYIRGWHRGSTSAHA